MKSHRYTYAVIVLSLLVLLPPLYAGRKVYSTASSFKTAIQNAVPGDTIELADGQYDIGGNSMTKSGTEQARILIRAEHRGKAEVKGKSSFACKGIAYLTIEGFLFTSDVSTVVKTESSNNIRITRNTFRLSETTSSKWILIGGTYNIAAANSHHNRIDHNLFDEKHQLGNYITIDGSPADLGSPEASQYDRIDHNYFRNIGPRAVNEMETIRIGQSEICRSSSYTLVEYNLFEECDGDPEIVSVKTKNCIIRYNTIKRSQGTICLRSSDSSTVEGNYFFGNGKIGTGGIRLYGSGHRIINNYFENLTGDTWDAACTITNGDAELTGSNTSHWRPQNITVAYNTYIGNANNFQFGFTNNGSYSKAPKNITIANNIVIGNQNQLVKVITQPSSMIFTGNIMLPQGAASIGVSVPDSQIRVIDPLLQFSDSFWRISASSPAVDAAAGSYDVAALDIDGQVRDARKDVGADEYSSGQRLSRPLVAADVGPDGPDSITVITSVRKNGNVAGVPSDMTLYQNFPNPFNPETIIEFTVPSEGWAVMKVFDVLGREVSTLFNDVASAGTRYSAAFNASSLPGGLYFSRLEFNGKSVVKKMILVK
jgi:parallel beta-helix repeat protein